MTDARTGLAYRLWAIEILLVGLVLALFFWRWSSAGLTPDRIGGAVTYAFPVGFLGSLVSGATGAGGGFVYVPIFDVLRDSGVVRMTFHQNIGTAFMIQSFGLAAAAIGWMIKLYGRAVPASEVSLPPEEMGGIVFATCCAAVPSIMITQNLVPLADRTLQTAFMIFALSLGGALLVFAWAFQRVDAWREKSEFFDLYMFFLIGVAGGYVTAFFSVGIGEFLAIYLIFRKYPVYASIAAALAVSAVTVFAGLWYNLATGRVVWDTAIAAIPGAILGGIVARWVAVWLGPLWIKTLLGVWIVGSSLYLIVRALM
jgi:uncharacterized membrane protein YfcA